MLYDEVYQMLKSHGQLHLLRNYDLLNDVEKEQLLQQLSSVDFSLLKYMSSKDELLTRGKLSPIKTLTLAEIEKNKDNYYKTGLNALQNHKIGVVLLAGGQGTRLGSDQPKGAINIGLTKELYIFECSIRNLLQVVEETGTWIPLYLMTSDKNNADTITFFKEHNYFGYRKDYLTFFTQEMAPSVDYNGKLFMESKSTLSLSPNGNGGWFYSLEKTGNLDKMKAQGIEWLNVIGVDNVLQKIADPYFVGATLSSNCSSSVKVVSKSSPDEKVGILCLEDGKPSIVEYYDMTPEMMVSKGADGILQYNYGVIVNYLFCIKDLESISSSSLPFHLVEKKIPYMDEHNNYINPVQPNGYKFEALILDMVHLIGTCLPYEVERSKEFAPVKNLTGVDSIETARALLAQSGYEL
ncbi:MAG: UTP--glucose-1-phosphate uridylyltransferase [Mobilitalea sp.]